MRTSPLPKIFFALVIFMVAHVTGFAQIQLGVKAGFNMSNVMLKDENGNRQSTNNTPGFHAGFIADINIASDIYFQPGLLFNTKGYEFDYALSGLSLSLTETPYYIEMPLQLLYKPELGKGKLLVGVGPYIAYGIGGRWTAEVAAGNSSLSQKGKLIFKNDTDGAILDSSSGGSFDLAEKQVYGKPFDAGGSILAGYEFRNLFIHLNGQMGLINLMPTINGVDTKMTGKNRQFGISVGYKF